MVSNFHTHTDYCDGVGSCLDYVTSAKAVGLVSLGFSSHAPLPFPCAWSLQENQLSTYLNELTQLQASHELEVYKGLEVDYIPNLTGPKKFKHLLDYTIGSIHFVDQLPDGTPWEIDGSHTLFCKGLDQVFNNNIEAVTHRYFELTREMVEKDCPDIIGHLDKIKIQNQYGSYFSEREPGYWNELKITLDHISRYGGIVEVNTRGLYQGKTTEPYPGYKALAYMYQKGIPITLNSDAHHPHQLTKGFIATVKELFRIGFRELHILQRGAWKAVPLTLYGVAC